MIDEQILALLRDHPGLKAKEIARRLNADRAIVNAALHGSLKGKAWQDTSYRWWPVSSAPKASSTVVRKNRYSDLIRYYLECLAIDDASGVSVFAASNYRLDYVELPTLPFAEDDSLLPDRAKDSSGVESLLERASRERKWNLSLGYPLRLRIHHARNGQEYRFVEPIFVWPIHTQDSDSGSADATLNPRALGLPASGQSTIEELVALSEELGLDQSAELDLDDLVARLRAIRPDWDWRDDLRPHNLQEAPPLSKIEVAGIYNRAAVFITERQPYTIGLERELHDLETIPEADIEASALGTLLLERAENQPPKSTSFEIIEPIPLNAEQREAVVRSLTEKLTVITGPPGTGKSQVVASILVNAAFNSQRVLFSSKNNKAVDVVQERVNDLAKQPFLLRLGGMDLNAALADHLAEILSFHPGKQERQAFAAMQGTLRKVKAELEASEDELERVIALRNELDTLDRTAQATRFKVAAGTSLSRVNLSQCRESTRHLRKAVDSADKTKASFLARLFWPLLRSRRLRQIYRVLDRVRSDIKSLGLGFSDSLSLSELRDLCDAMQTRLRLIELFQRLQAAPDIGSLAAKQLGYLREIQNISRQLWASWLLLRADRLSHTERRQLGDYVALLKLMVKADNEESKSQKKLWAQYYQAAAKAISALPCWAVTSLSVRGRVPFKSGLFDLAVIDEASQCDIASALPVLFRAKRAVIIGDPQQLRHISRLDAKRDKQLMDKYGVLSFPGPSWAYGVNSLYDLASSRAGTENVVALLDHHRSHGDIISFSNEQFYGGQLRVATDYTRLKIPSDKIVRWIDVTGTTYRPSTGGAVNQDEAKQVIAELRQLFLEQRFVGDVGVVTPFREQANKIQELLNKDNALWALLNSHDFLCQTAHRFQGDERDLILFSPVISRDAPETAKYFLRRTQNLFNVAITRARGGLWVVGDRHACATSGVDYLERFVRYVDDLDKRSIQIDSSRPPTSAEYPTVSNPEQVSEWEKILYTALYDAGVRTIPQYAVDKYLLDLAVIDGERRLDIEVDGERFHREWNGELTRRDQLRNMRLIEMGWDVMRFWVYQVRDDLDFCVQKVQDWLHSGQGVQSEPSTTTPHTVAPDTTTDLKHKNSQPRANLVTCPVCGYEGIYKQCPECGYRTDPWTFN